MSASAAPHGCKGAGSMGKSWWGIASVRLWKWKKGTLRENCCWGCAKKDGKDRKGSLDTAFLALAL